MSLTSVIEGVKVTALEGIVLDNLEEAMPPRPDTTWHPFGTLSYRMRKLTVGRNKNDGLLEVFGIARDGKIYLTWQRADGSWSNWMRFCDETDKFADITVANNQSGRLEAFAVGGDDSVWHTWQLEAGGWNKWVPFKNQSVKMFKIVVGKNNNDGLLEVFGLARDGKIYLTWQQTDGNWSKWMRFCDETDKFADITVANNQSGRLEAFAVGMDDSLWHTWQLEAGGWNKWVLFHSTSNRLQMMAVGAQQNGLLIVLGIARGATVWHTRQLDLNGGWSAWAPFHSESDRLRTLSIDTNLDGRLEVFGVAWDESVWHTWQSESNGGWSGWAPCHAKADRLVDIVASKNRDGRLEVFGVARDDSLWHTWQTTPNNGWAVHAPVLIYAGDDIQAAVNTHPEHTVFILKGVNKNGEAAVHRMQQVIPKNGQQFFGERNAQNERITVMSGAQVLPAPLWKPCFDLPFGVLYRYDAAPIQPGRRVIAGKGKDSQGNSDTTAPCTRPEDLYITTNNQCRFLRRVRTKEEVIPGETWYFDEARQQLFIRDDPGVSGRLIEISLLRFAFGYNVNAPGLYTPDWPLGKDPHEKSEHPNIYASDDLYSSKPDNVLIKDLIIEKYACPAQSGAIGYHRPGNDWIILNNEVRFNHAGGVALKGRAIVWGNFIHHNGQFGLTAGDGNRLQEHGGGPQGLEEWGFNGGYAGSGARVESNVIEHNNYLNFNAGWGAGGSKFSQCYDLILRNNFVRYNDGPGLWADFSYKNIIFEGNLLRDNVGPGIMHETGFDAIVRNNTLIDNATDPGGNYNAQIYLSASSGTCGKTLDVQDNVVMFTKHTTGYRHGIMAVQGAFSPEKTRTIEEFPVRCENIRVNRNIIVSMIPEIPEQSAGVSGVADNYHKALLFGPINILFDENQYRFPDPQGNHWRWPHVGHVTLEQFREQGQEANGMVEGIVAPNIMAAGKDGKLYRYDEVKGAFALIQGLGVTIEGGLAFSGFHVASDGKIWRLTKEKGWVKTSGCEAQDVGASYDGKVAYACGKDGQLYSFDHVNSRFTQVSVAAKRVAVDNNGVPWIINNAGQVFRLDPLYGWLRAHGVTAQDIGCGGGEVYACATDEKLYRFNHGQDRFDLIQGLGVRISVGGDGIAWHVSKNGTVWRLTDDRGWVEVKGCVAQDIGL